MSKTILLASVFVLATAGLASAGGQAGALGVGAEYELNGIGGLSLNYDAGKFHAGGWFRFLDPAGGNNTEFDVGGRFFYHLHSTAMADFSLGAGLGIASLPPGMMNPNRNTNMFLEPGFQIRAFIASNVALSFIGGISIGVIDASGVVISGQAEGIAGIHYYFF
jgi:hypothetical protein